MDIFIQLTGANMSPEQKAKLKAETQLVKAMAKAAASADDEGNGSLTELIEGLKE